MAEFDLLATFSFAAEMKVEPDAENSEPVQHKFAPSHCRLPRFRSKSKPESPANTGFRAEGDLRTFRERREKRGKTTRNRTSVDPADLRTKPRSRANTGLARDVKKARAMSGLFEWWGEEDRTLDLRKPSHVLDNI